MRHTRTSGKLNKARAGRFSGQKVAVVQKRKQGHHPQVRKHPLSLHKPSDPPTQPPIHRPTYQPMHSPTNPPAMCYSSAAVRTADKLCIDLYKKARNLPKDHPARCCRVVWWRRSSVWSTFPPFRSFDFLCWSCVGLAIPRGFEFDHL